MELENLDYVEIQGDLLNPARLMLLVDIAHFEIREVLEISERIGLISPFDYRKEIEERMSEIGGIGMWLSSKRLNLINKNLTKHGTAYFSELGYLFSKNKKIFGKSQGFDKNRFHACSSQLPYLYSVLRGQRNISTHPDKGLMRKLVNRPQLITLCGAILSILDLSSPDNDEVKNKIENYAKKVRKFMEMLTGEIGTTEELNERVVRLTGALKSKQAEVNQLLDEKQRLVQKYDGKSPTENKLIKSVNDAYDRIIERLETAQKNQTEESDLVSDRMAKEFGDLDSKISSLLEIVHSESQKIIDHVSTTSELVSASNDTEEDEQIDDYEEDEDDFEESEESLDDEEEEDDEEEDFDEDDEEDEVDMLTPLMAEAKLRELRNRIRREMNVDPWENICMIRPIVSEALIAAQYGGMNTIDNWKDIPNIARKYRRHRAIMDRQLEEYGDEMMDIYRSVERRYVDDD